MTDAAEKLPARSVSRLRAILRTYLAPRVVEDVMRALEARPNVVVTAEIDALAAADVRRKAG